MLVKLNKLIPKVNGYVKKMKSKIRLKLDDNDEKVVQFVYQSKEYKEII